MQLSLEIWLHQWDGIRPTSHFNAYIMNVKERAVEVPWCEREGLDVRERGWLKAIDVCQFSHSMRVHNWDTLLLHCPHKGERKV